MMLEKLSSEIAKVRNILKTASHVLVLTGAGISAESGIPTFRGAGGLWRKYDATSLATPQAFRQNPALVWEFYHYRRELVLKCEPNAAHAALVKLENQLLNDNKKFSLVTQNVDDLHFRAGSKTIYRLHGSLFETICTKCKVRKHNVDSPICKGLEGKGLPEAEDISIPLKDLPRCDECGGLIRPGVVWFGESLDQSVLEKVDELVNECDLCFVIGTSSVVYPAAAFAPQVSARGKPVVEFNVEGTAVSSSFLHHIEGPCAKTLPLIIE